MDGITSKIMVQPTNDAHEFPEGAHDLLKLMKLMQPLQISANNVHSSLAIESMFFFNEFS